MEDAFCDCYGLTTVTLGDGLEEIGEQVFRYCRSLRRMVISNMLRIDNLRTITHWDTFATYLAYLPSIRVPLGYSPASRLFYCGTNIFILGFSRRTLGDSQILLWILTQRLLSVFAHIFRLE
jgi:hypothetical protein